MAEDSYLSSVNTFRQVKEDVRCDDVSAAILTLAQHVSMLNVNLQVSDDGYPERLGKNIADAIEAVTKDGQIQVKVEAESLVEGRIVTGESGVSRRTVSSRTTVKPKRKSKR